MDLEHGGFPGCCGAKVVYNFSNFADDPNDAEDDSTAEIVSAVSSEIEFAKRTNQAFLIAILHVNQERPHAALKQLGFKCTKKTSRAPVHGNTEQKNLRLYWLGLGEE